MEELFDRRSYRDMSSLHPPSAPWHLRASNSSSEALNPQFFEFESESDLHMKDEEYVVVAIWGQWGCLFND